MSGLCGTRALKSARQIQSVAPQFFASRKPDEGFSSVVPFDILNRFNRITETDLKGTPALLDVYRQLEKLKFPPPPKLPGTPAKPASATRPRGLIFADDPFKGTVYLAQITFQVGASSVVISDADMATIAQYCTVAFPAISQYCAQYGDNSLKLSPTILKLTVQTPQGKYNDDTLQGWIRGLFLTINTPISDSCIVVFNPTGVVNTDGTGNILGYHNEVIVEKSTGPFNQFFAGPFCFVNVKGTPLTVADRADVYVDTISHELAEMVCDPFASWTNPEVCDACAGNCNKNWRSFFANAPGGGFTYLRSNPGPLPLNINYDFLTAAVAQTPYPDQCPAPDAGCAYAPSAKQGVGELLFYEKPNGYAELYSVDAKGSIDIQTIQTDWRNTWSLIVPGRYTSKPAGSRADLLFYLPGHGEFYQTGLLGDMHQFSVHDNWRTTWSIIVPGSFSAAGAMDLLFYEPSDGFGEFDHTDGRGNLSLIINETGWATDWKIILPGRFSSKPTTGLLFYAPSRGVGQIYDIDSHGMSVLQTYTNWRNTWTIIVPGHFSNSGYTDLLFYSPSEGTGEFYSTDGHGGINLLKTYTNWRKTWTQIVPGHFSNGSYTDLLFYSPTEGTGEFYSTDGHGGINLISTHTNWRKTWTTVLSL